MPLPGDDDNASAAARLHALAPPGWTPSQGAGAPTRLLVDSAAGGVSSAWRERISVVASARSLVWLLVAGALVVAVSTLALARHHGVPAPEPTAGFGAGPAPAPVPTSPPQIVVDVGGRVRHPGLVTLASGARVADAIAAAGGAVDAVDLARLDLAARVSDGQLLLIGVPGAGISGAGISGGGTDGASPVDLNAATVEQLDALPGVGPVLAQRIVSWRDAHGGFRSVDELQQVPGIGARKYADLKALVAL